MTVEDRIRYGSGRGNEHEDKKFPVGMRVLAVDDDPTCLKMLEGLLRRCEYHVTTTNQAIKALNMLREKKDWFDLVISDVHMPDMDGFKLLELVGLEMDLPVIMLSANSDPNSVMKGINHGACDYLLKPVRLEELKNIWMHVYRKRNKETSSHNNCDDYEDCDRNYAVNSSEAGSGVVAVPGGGGGGGSDRVVVSSSKLNRKRQKDQYQDEDDDIGDFDDNGGGHENDDSSAQNKKPRVVWSVELHKKFVQAVNQLGLDKAMPKKILDLMNVDKLTRENVASHLQKYRLYLKRIHDQKQQESLAVALSARGAASYLPMGQLHVAARNYHGFSAAAAAGHHLPASMQLTPFHQQAAAAALGRMNSMNCSGAAAAYGIGSSGAGGGMMQLGRTQSSIPNSSHFQDLGRLPQINFGGNPRPNLLQGIPTSLESNQLLNDRILLQQNSIASSSSFPDPDMSFTDMGNSFNLAASNNSLILPNQQQQSLQPSNGFGGQISTELPSLSTNLFEIGARASSNLPALDSCNTSWQGGAAPLTAGYPTNMSPISACDLGNTLSSVSLAPDNNINNTVHPGNSVTSTLSDSMINQTIPLEGNTIIHASISGDSTNFLNASNTGNHLASGWNEQRSRTLVGLFQSPQPGSTLTTVSSIPNVSPQGFDNGLFETNTASMPPMDDQSRFAVDDLPYSQNMGQQGFTPQSHLKSRDEYTVMNDANNLAHVNMFEELMNATYFLPDNDGGLTGGRCM